MCYTRHMVAKSDAADEQPASAPPPRPEVTLAVLREGEEGPILELHLARLLHDSDVFAQNISRDPSGSWSAAINLNALEGTRLYPSGHRRAVIRMGPGGCHELQVTEGDSLLVCQYHRTKGRSAQSLVTVLRGARS